MCGWGMLSFSLQDLAGQGQQAVLIVHCPRLGQEALSVPNCLCGLIYSEEPRTCACTCFSRGQLLTQRGSWEEPPV